MGAGRVIHFFVLLLLFSTLVAANPRRNKDSEDHLLANLINSVAINRDMVEMLWLNCRIELIRANEAVGDLNYHFTEEDSGGRDKVLVNSRSEKHKHADVLHPLVKQALLGCLREKDLLFLTCGEEKDSPNWYTRCVELLFSGHGAPKRRKLKEAPASKPSKSQGSKKESDGGTPGVAIIAGAVGGCAVIALLCICCCCLCSRTGSNKGLNDERPLLSLSSSDYSSSHKSSALGASFSNAGNHSIDNNPHDDSTIEIPLGTAANSDKVPSGRMGPAGMPPLKPPPGSGMPPLKPPPGSGMPPLKPPPGRAIPSEPPAKLAPTPPPPPAKPSSPGPPAPAPPPPPLKPSSGGPRPAAPGPPPPPPTKSGPRPPPPGGPPRPPPPGGGPPRPPSTGVKPPRHSPLGPPRPPSTSDATDAEEYDASKAKLKPFFWDKVAANANQSMVWHQVKAGSFQFDEEQIETLFGYVAADKKKSGSKKDSSEDVTKLFIQIIDQKKAQNLSILLKALNVTTEEVCDALKEGNELPAELLQTLIKMAPTAEEELKLRLYDGDLSRLGQAERFLKALVEVPFAFKRLETLLFMCSLQDETSLIKESFVTLEAACTELRKSRLFLKLLEAVLKTGNRMNNGTFRGGAQAFKLDTLLKLSDVKGVDGKTTLLHFVVQEIIRSEGIRAARAARDQRSISSIASDDLLEDLPQDSEDYYRSTGLQVVSGLSNELENVKRAAILDADSITNTVAKLGHGLIKARDFLNTEMKNIPDEDGFHQTMKNFIQNAEGDVMSLLEEEKRIMALVKSTGDYFHGSAKKDEGLRLFSIVRDFLVILDKVCKEVKSAPKKQNSTPRRESVAITTSDSTPSPQPDQSTPSLQPDQSTSSPQPDQSTSSPRPDQSTSSPQPDQSTSSPQPDQSTSSPGPDQSTSSPGPDQSTSSPRPDQSTSSLRPDPRQKVLAAIADRRVDDSSSDDDDP